MKRRRIHVVVLTGLLAAGCHTHQTNRSNAVSTASATTSRSSPPASPFVETSREVRITIAHHERLLPLALSDDGNLIVEVSKPPRSGATAANGAELLGDIGIALYDPRTTRMQMLHRFSNQQDQVIYAAGSRHWIVWDVTAAQSLDSPDWRLFAYDRHARRTQFILRNPVPQGGAAPDPVLFGSNAYWSSNSPDNTSLDLYRADLKHPRGSVRDVRSNIDAPQIAGDTLFALQRVGASNVLVSFPVDQPGHLHTWGAARNLFAFAALPHGVVYVPKNDNHLYRLFDPTAPTHAFAPDPGSGFIASLSAGNGFLAINQEDVGELVRLSNRQVRILSRREAANFVLARGCYAFWQTGATASPLGHWTNLCR